MAEETVWATAVRSLDNQMAELTVQLPSGESTSMMIPREPLIDVEEDDY